MLAAVVDNASMVPAKCPQVRRARATSSASQAAAGPQAPVGNLPVRAAPPMQNAPVDRAAAHANSSPWEILAVRAQNAPLACAGWCTVSINHMALHALRTHNAGQRCAIPDTARFQKPAADHVPITTNA